MDGMPMWIVIGLVAGISAMIFGGKNKNQTNTNSNNQVNNQKRKKNSSAVVVYCPYCGVEIGLEKVRNYICSSCNNVVAYYETYENINPRTDLANYNCASCGTLNFENVKYCLNCGQEHGPTIRY